MSTRDFLLNGRQKIEEALFRGNLEALNEIYAPDIVAHMPPYPDLIGLDAIKQNMRSFPKIGKITSITWDELVVEGNTTAERYTMYIKTASGQNLAVKSAIFLHWKDGKAVEEFAYRDYSGLLP